jgi:hypothetical protein
MAISTGRSGIGQSCVLALALLLLAAPFLDAQPLESARTPSSTSMMPAPFPADVLTPNTRQNTPYFKVAARAGLNWAAYANDRYIDNTPLDVGKTSGEQAVYSHVSGFGYGGGGEFEYPINTGFSVVGSIEFVRASFGREGPVSQESLTRDGAEVVAVSRHEWSASLSYLKFGAAAKLAFPSFYLLLGLTADRMLTSRVVRTRSFEDPTYTFPETRGLSEIVEDAPIDDPTGLHFAVRTGFGLVYQIADGLQFSPELTLDFGRGSINKSPESDLDIYSLSAVLRYELR